jgi:hypothetical protein
MSDPTLLVTLDLLEARCACCNARQKLTRAAQAQRFAREHYHHGKMTYVGTITEPEALRDELVEFEILPEEVVQ